jgi:carboxyl-terminal processing protease
MNKSTRIASYIAIFGIVFSTGLLVGNSMPTHSLVNEPAGNTTNILGGLTTKDQPSQDISLKTFWQVRDILQKKYIHTEKLDGQAMSYGAVKGMVEALDDPYTEFMDPQDTLDFNESLNSELEGIGAEMTVRDQLLLVVSVLKGSPAEKEGLLPDDVILQIDGLPVSDLSLYDAIKKIRGKKGTTVVLTVIRKDKTDPFEIKITRDTITVESVMSEEVSPGIWHVSLNQFSDDTKMEFNRILNEIKLKNPKGIILDLRFNGGGYLDGAVDILSGFIRGEKQVVSIDYRDDKSDEKLKTSGNPQFPDLPLVVLINKGSASASEIVAAAIQDLKRGLLMGETSYGKGTVQEVDPLPDGSSLRFTIARWLSPNGRDINKKGVVPDREVLFKDEDYDKKFDRQLDEAVKYLKTL